MSDNLLDHLFIYYYYYVFDIRLSLTFKGAMNFSLWFEHGSKSSFKM